VAGLVQLPEGRDILGISGIGFYQGGLAYFIAEPAIGAGGKIKIAGIVGPEACGQNKGGKPCRIDPVKGCQSPLVISRKGVVHLAVFQEGAETKLVCIPRAAVKKIAANPSKVNPLGSLGWGRLPICIGRYPAGFGFNVNGNAAQVHPTVLRGAHGPAIHKNQDRTGPAAAPDGNPAGKSVGSGLHIHPGHAEMINLSAIN